MKKRTKNILGFSILILLIIFWVVLFRYINPQLLVAKIGATNGYLILFLLGALGGVSIFTGPSYFIALTTLAIGGLNPLLLGLAGGCGVTIGDSVIFLLGVSAGKKAPEKFQKKLEGLEKRTKNKPDWLVNLILYLYIGFTPLPNEIATIALGLIGYKKKVIIFFLLLGNITSGILTAMLIKFGISLFGG
ncbi:MAG: hypothetical protein M1165_02250 [Candidatus Pacearchaeota archaeon]|jgi:membrane protein YqaA with SNARE-associated domain|nr:hypothetical protein [Candidatus Pacearchaeota archaeon]